MCCPLKLTLILIILSLLMIFQSKNSFTFVMINVTSSLWHHHQSWIKFGLFLSYGEKRLSRLLSCSSLGDMKWNNLPQDDIKDAGEFSGTRKTIYLPIFLVAVMKRIGFLYRWSLASDSCFSDLSQYSGHLQRYGFGHSSKSAYLKRSIFSFNPQILCKCGTVISALRSYQRWHFI